MMGRRLRPVIALALVAFASSATAQRVASSAIEARIAEHAAAHNVPETLVRRVIRIESGGNPRLVSKGNYGLMQIRIETARAMGYRGSAEGLLDAETNMTYAVKYLAGAYEMAGGNQDRAIYNYQHGYQYNPKAIAVAAAAPGPSWRSRRRKPRPGRRLPQRRRRFRSRQRRGLPPLQCRRRRRRAIRCR